MSENTGGEKPQIEVSSDEDWKSQVKADDARMDAERAGSPEGPGPRAASELPPASFAMLVQMFSTQAIVALGLIPAPDGKTERHLPLARHFIDLLSVLEEKSKGNLTADESRLLENTLHELRIAFVDVSRQPPEA